MPGNKIDPSSGTSRNQRPSEREDRVTSCRKVRKSESYQVTLTYSAKDRPFSFRAGGAGVWAKSAQIAHKIIPALVFKNKEMFNETRQTILSLSDEENRSKKLGPEKEVGPKMVHTPIPFSRTMMVCPFCEHLPESLQTIGL